MVRSMARAWAGELLSTTNDAQEDVAEILKDINALQEDLDKAQQQIMRMGEGREGEVSRYHEEIGRVDDPETLKGREPAERRAKAAALDTLARRMRSGAASSAEISATLKAVMG